MLSQGGGVSILPYVKGSETAAIDCVEIEREAELVRLLYVALTRPQKRLVVCGKRALPGAGGRTAGLEGLLRDRMDEGPVLAGLFGEHPVYQWRLAVGYGIAHNRIVIGTALLPGAHDPC